MGYYADRDESLYYDYRDEAEYLKSTPYDKRVELKKGMWRTTQGQVIGIKKMKTSHIKNTLKYFNSDRTISFLSNDKIKELDNELIKRGVIFIHNGTPNYTTAIEPEIFDEQT